MLVWTGAASVAAGADRDTSFVREEVTYLHRDVRLAGTILRPDRGGPLPAVVMVHGSGTSSRSNPWTTAYAEALARRGILVLHPDKRGSGDSGGSWQAASFETLAGDALAGVRFLGTRADLDLSHVGLIGFSQGGHIVPVAAARSTEVSFVIDVSGSLVPMTQQILDEVDLAARRAGLSKEQRDLVNRVHERLVEFGTAGEGWTEYQTARTEALERADSVAASIIRAFPNDRNHWVFDWVRAVGDFDPLPYWEKVEVPVLFVFGGRDENVNVSRSVSRLQNELADELRYTLTVFAQNGHAIYREDLLDLAASWIREAR